MKTIREMIGQREVFSVDTSLTVSEVVDYLCEKSIGAVAICEGNKVVGVFSERDLLRRVVHKGLDIEKTKVTDVMTTKVFHVSLDERHSVAKALMLNKNFRHLVVLDKSRRLRGFVSIRELIEVDLEATKDLIHKLNDDYYGQEFKSPEE